MGIFHFLVINVTVMEPVHSLLEKLLFSSSVHGRINLYDTEDSDPEQGICAQRATGPFGAIDFLEIREDTYNYRVGSFTMREDMTLSIVLDIPYLGVLINLGSNLTYSQAGIKPGTLKERQCSLISLPELNLKCRMHKGLSYQTFGVFFSTEYLREWSKAFPALSRFLVKVEQKIPVFDHLELADDSDIAERARHIISHTERSGHGRLYRRHKIDDLLFSILETYEGGATRIKLHPRDVRALHEIRDYLETHPEQGDLSLKKLSQRAGMNIFKLKYGFKKLFGAPVFTFAFDVRMNIARELLTGTDKPISEIAGMVGYKGTSSFIQAFKKKYGYPPGRLR